jgi:hypothetical protein
MFVTFNVDDDLKATLLRPYLNDRARSLLARYDPIRRVLRITNELNSIYCTSFI